MLPFKRKNNKNMAEITCCTGATCDGLLTLGYMESLMTNCKTLKKGGTAYNGCCNASSSSTVVNYNQATSGTYANIRSTDNTNPNNDISGFNFTVPSNRRNSDCCSVSNTGNTILKKSEATYGYTEASGNTLSVVTRPSACSLGYSVTETRGYKIYTKNCSGNSSSTTSVTVSHSGEITKNYTKEQNNTKWNVSFGTATITGLTSDDCGHQYTSSTALTVGGYSVGYTLSSGWTTYCKSGGSVPKVPCNGADFIMEYSANTNCANDFSIAFSGKSDSNECPIQLTSQESPLSCDTTIKASISSGSPITVGGASIVVYTVTFKIGTNSGSHSKGSFKIAVTIGGNTEVYECEYDRELCAWTAGTVRSSQYCNGYWPCITDWTNPPSPSDAQDVIQVGNCSSC